MSRLVSRILLSIFIFPLAAVFYGLTGAIGESSLRGSLNYGSRELTVFFLADALTWAFVAVYWFLLWRASVQWTPRRVTATVVSFPAAVGAGLVAAVIFTAAVRSVGNDWSFGAFIGGVIGILLWLVSTVFLWRETAAERASRLTGASKSAMTCPTCGYNLTGLSTSRCPECGSQFTLDELVALQPKAEVDIE